MRSQSLEQKLDVLMSLAADDREGLPPRLRHTKAVGALRPLNIRNLRPSPGMRMSLLRILMTNACSYNCHYCPMRRDRPMPRTLLKPEELVRIFLEARRRGWCQGLFITTGIPGRPTKVMDDLIQVLELLRERHRFGGYIHVKLVAGSETAQIDRLTALASRVSLNFEAPCGKSLAQIAPGEELLHHAARLRAGAEAGGAGTGGAGAGEAEGPTSSRRRLRHDHAVRRRRHAGHRPVPARAPSAGSRLAAACTILISALSAPSAILRWKEHPPPRPCASTGSIRRPTCWETTDSRPEEVVYEAERQSSAGARPQECLGAGPSGAVSGRSGTASYEELVRVPGHRAPGRAPDRGGAKRSAPSVGWPICRKLGVVTTRAGGFLTLRGRRLQTTRWTEQLGFWAPEDEVGTHHVVYQVSPGTFR